MVTALVDQCLPSAGNSVNLDTTITGPGAPGSVTATTVSSSAITVTWMAPADAGSRGDRQATVTGYVITRNGESMGTVTGTSYADTGLAAETTYTYSVTTVNSFGETSVAATASATTDAVVVPILGSAYGLSAAAGPDAGMVNLTWIAGMNSTRHYLAGIKVSDWRAQDYSNVIFRADGGSER